jgi:hypothetical protein
VRIQTLLGGLALAVAACSSSIAPSHGPSDPLRPAASGATTGHHRLPSFVAFRAVRPARLRVVRPETGRVAWSGPIPSSEGFAASLRRHVAYLPVRRRHCHLTVLRIPLRPSSTSRGVIRRVASIQAGAIDDVDALPALSGDGSQLALIAAYPLSARSDPRHENCGDRESLLIVQLPKGTREHPQPKVRYLSSGRAEELDDLVWDHDRLLVRITQVRRDGDVSRVRDVGPATRSLSAARVVLRESQGDPGPVFPYRGCLSVLSHRGIHCVRHGRVTPQQRFPAGLPRHVTQVSVAAESRKLLLLQTANGTTYWSDGFSAHQIPVTVNGVWGESTWS